MSPEHSSPSTRAPVGLRAKARPRMHLALRTLGSLLLGLVAIWGAVLAVGKGLVPLIDTQFQPGPEVLSVIRRSGIFLAAIASYWAYVHWHEKRAATELRLRPLPLLLGGVGGAALIGLPILLLYALGAYQLVAFHGVSSSLPGVAGLIIIAATLEELTFSCLIFRVTERHFGTIRALAVNAVLFALNHLENVTSGEGGDVVAMLVNVALGALLWSGVFIFTRNLWAVVANHAAWNFTILLSGLPLSGIKDWLAVAPLESRYAGPDWLTGGMFGPESSLVVIVLTAVPTALLLRVAWRRGAFIQPMRMKQREPAS